MAGEAHAAIQYVRDPADVSKIKPAPTNGDGAPKVSIAEGIALKGYAAAWTAPDAEVLTDLTWDPELPSVVRSVLVSCPLSNADTVYIRPPTVGAGGVEIEPGGSWTLFPAHPDRIDLSGYEISGSGTDRATLMANGGDP